MVFFDRTISPGGVGKITLSARTQGYRGSIRKQAVVHSNDPKNKQITLTLLAFVKMPDNVKSLLPSEQVPGQDSVGRRPPPGGQPSPPSQSPPGAEEKPPPPLLPQKETEEQGFPELDQKRVPDANLPGPPEVQNMRSEPTS